MGQLTQTTAEIQDAIDQQYDGEQANAVGWDDLTTSLIGRRLNSSSGAVDYNWEENSISFGANGDITSIGDCVSWNLQKPHGTKSDSTLNTHFHWEQTDSTTREITLWYRIQDNDSAKTTSWTEVVVDTNANNVFTYPGSGTFNQITTLVDVDWSSVSISSTVQFRMTRSDSVSGDIDVVFVDGHYATDQERGSRQEFVK